MKTFKEYLNEEFKTGDYVKHTKSGAVGKIVNVASDKAAVDVKWNSGKTTTTDPKKLSKFNLKEDLSEATQEKDLDPKKKIVVKGVKGAKSKPFVKKFRNMDAYDKWTDSDEFGDFEVHQIMNESEETEENALNESNEIKVLDQLLDLAKKAKVNNNKVAYENYLLAIYNANDSIKMKKYVDAATKAEK